MAFIRVVGDLRIDYRDASQPVVRKERRGGDGERVRDRALRARADEPARGRDARRARAKADRSSSVENRRIEVFVGSEGSGGAWEAHVVASDAESDLAALQVTAADLPVPAARRLGRDRGGAAGEAAGVPVRASGRGGEAGRADVIPQVTVTAGSLSAARADDAGDTRYLQTDATMLPGNSGGPMLDEDGYVVGVVKMKLSRDATSAGAGFTVPVNVVKDFLEANGLLERLPVVRLRPGVRHSLDWKRVAVELPDGYLGPLAVARRSRRRARSARSTSAWTAGRRRGRLAGLEEALLGGQAVPGFVPAAGGAGPSQSPGSAGPPRRSPRASPASLIGSAVGTDALRPPLPRRVRDRGPGGARRSSRGTSGPADAVAFNLGLLRRSLRSLEAAPMLFNAAAAVRCGEPGRRARGRLVPERARGVVAPARAGRASRPPQAACEAAAAGRTPACSCGHPSDYTLVLRALRWGRSAGAGAGARRLRRAAVAGRAAAGPGKPPTPSASTASACRSPSGASSCSARARPAARARGADRQAADRRGALRPLGQAGRREPLSTRRAPSEPALNPVGCRYLVKVGQDAKTVNLYEAKTHLSELVERASKAKRSSSRRRGSQGAPGAARPAGETPQAGRLEGPDRDRPRLRRSAAG